MKQTKRAIPPISKKGKRRDVLGNAGTDRGIPGKATCDVPCRAIPLADRDEEFSREYRKLFAGILRGGNLGESAAPSGQ
jgi:hypothetical protein